MKLTVLGCSGTYPGPDSACSAYLLEADGFRLLMDAGNGSLGALQRHCDLRDVDAVLLSHLHADHCLDLVAYSYARRYHPEGPQPLLPVYGPAGTGDRLCNAFDHRPPDGLTGVYDFRVTSPGKAEIGPFAVEQVRVNHPVEAYGIRLTTGGRSLTYSGDTGTSRDLVELAEGTDLFLCEASWADEPDLPPGVHLTGREAGEHATGAGVGRLLLTHLVPGCDKELTREGAAATFDGDVDLARTDESHEV